MLRKAQHDSHMAVEASLVMGTFALANHWSHCIERMERVGLEKKYGRDFEVPLTTD
jgi:hypothetical protein